MTVDPRAALDRFTAALEAHFHAITSRSGEDDPRVDDAYDVLADAFEVYDDALVAVHGETTPFDLAEDDEDDDSDDDFEDDDFEDEDEGDSDEGDSDKGDSDEGDSDKDDSDDEGAGASRG